MTNTCENVHIHTYITFSSWWRAIQTWTLSMVCQKRKAPNDMPKNVATLTIIPVSAIQTILFSLKCNYVNSTGICCYYVCLFSLFFSWVDELRQNDAVGPGMNNKRRRLVMLAYVELRFLFMVIITVLKANFIKSLFIFSNQKLQDIF